MTGAPRRRMDLVVGELKNEEETVLLDLETAQVVSLNPTAAAIWYLCDGKRDVVAIAAEMRAVFPDVAKEKIEREVVSMIETLARERLLG
jgi:hypothetical protein